MRVYRLLLGVFPASFRARFGEDMVTLFTERLRDAERTGVLGLSLFWIRTCADVVLQGSRERAALLIAGLAQDLRFAVRILGRRPGFAAASILTLALGVGANVAVFSAIRAVLIDESPYAGGDRLVMIWQVMTRAMPQGFSVGDYETLRPRLTSFDALAGCGWTRALARGNGLSEEVTASGVTPGFFDVFGVKPLAGRALAGADFEPGGSPVVISAGVWESQFGRDPNVVGQTLRLDRETWTVVGVMPASFVPACSSGSESFIWRPMRLTPADRASRRTVMYLFGRLARAATTANAQAELDVVMADRLRDRNDPPGPFAFTGAALEAVGQGEAEAIRPGLVLIQGITAFLLLITAANLANLFLAEASTRRREFGVRTALGAGRHRLVRQLLTEAAVVATAGGALGIAVAYWTVPLFESFAAPVLPRGLSLDVGDTEVIVGLALSWLTMMVFGIAPALIASRTDILDALRDATHLTAGRFVRTFRSSLIVVEVLLAIVVLTGAGLFIRSFLNVFAIPVGFDTRGLVGGDIRLAADPNEKDEPRAGELTRRITDDLHARLGPVPIAFSLFSPFEVGMTTIEQYWSLVRGANLDTSIALRANNRVVTPNYFDVVGVPLVRGRLLRPDEAGVAVVVTERFVERFGAGGDLIGAEIRDAQSRMTIVGVVGDTQVTRLTSSPPDAFYSLLDPGPASSLTVLVRARQEAQAVAAIKDVVRAIDPDLPLMRVESLATTVSRSEERRHFYVTLVSVFAGLSGVLAAIGIYGVVAHVTGLRTRELGIRLALGARPVQLTRLVLRQGLVPVAIGLSAGLVVAWWMTDVIRTNTVFSAQLYKVTPHDPGTFAAVGLGLALVAIVACWIPARRTTRVDPASVLRAE